MKPITDGLITYAPLEWYFRCLPQCGEPYEQGGFASQVEACEAAKEYARDRLGINHGLLLVGRSDRMTTSLRMNWPEATQ